MHFNKDVNVCTSKLNKLREKNVWDECTNVSRSGASAK